MFILVIFVLYTFTAVAKFQAYIWALLNSNVLHIMTLHRVNDNESGFSCVGMGHFHGSDAVIYKNNTHISAGFLGRALVHKFSSILYILIILEYLKH